MPDSPARPSSAGRAVVTATHVAIVSSRATVALARESVRSVPRHLPDAEVHVADLDGAYWPVAAERVMLPAVLGLDIAQLHRPAVIHGLASVSRLLHAALVTELADDTSTVLVMMPGAVHCEEFGGVAPGGCEVGLTGPAAVHRQCRGRPGDPRQPRCGGARE